MESFIQDPEGVFFVVWFYLGPLPLAMGTVAGKIRSAEASQRGIAALSHGLQEHEACVIVAIGLEKDKGVVESVRCLQQPKRVTFGRLALLLSSTSPLFLLLHLFFISPRRAGREGS